MVGSITKKMSDKELSNYLQNFARAEMHQSDETVRVSSKAIRGTMISLGYDVDWVETVFRDAIGNKLEELREKKETCFKSSLSTDKYSSDKLRIIAELLKIREKCGSFNLSESEVLRKQMLLEGVSEEVVDIFIDDTFPQLVTVIDSYQKQISDLIFYFIGNT